MIKVISTKNGQSEQSQFDFLSQWEAHLAANASYFEGYTHEVIDISEEWLLQEKLKLRAIEMKACQDAIAFIGVINKTKAPDIVVQILSDATMSKVLGALNGGSPKTAKGFIQTLGNELYSDEEKAKVYAILDPAIDLPQPQLPVEPVVEEPSQPEEPVEEPQPEPEPEPQPEQ